MSDYDDVVNSLRLIMSAVRYVNFRQATTGKLNADGSLNLDATDGLPDGYIWVRFGEDRTAAVVKNVTMRNAAGVHVEVAYDTYHQEDQVWEVDRVRALTALGSATAAAMNIPAVGAAIPTPISARDVTFLNLFPDESSGLVVRVTAGMLPSGVWWDGATTATLTPTTSGGKKSLVLVGIDPVALTYVTTLAADRTFAEDLISDRALTEDGAADVKAVMDADPATVWIGAVELTNGDTTINASQVASFFWRMPVMRGASSSAAGTTGFVPAPTAGDEAKFLRGDGTWADTYDRIELNEVSPPSTPASGKVRIYAKSDGKVYSKDDEGTEYDLTASGGGSGALNAFAASFDGGSYSSSLSKWAFTTELYDPDGVYDAPNSRFTAPSTGVWYLSFNTANNSSPGKYPRFRKNGSTDISGSTIYATTGNLGTAVVVALSAGDYVEVWATGDSSYSTIGWGNFSGFKLGAGGGSSYYQTTRINGSALTQRGKVNYLSGTGITVSGADDADNDESEISFALDIDGLAGASIDGAADYLAFYDASGTTHSKVLFNTLFGAPPAIGVITPAAGSFTAFDTSGNAVIGVAGANTARLNVNGAASGKGVIVRVNATTPGNALEIQNSAGTVQSSQDATGKLTMEGAGTRILVRDLADAGATIIRAERGSGGSLGYVEVTGNTTPSIVLNAAGGFNAVLEFKTAGTTNMSFGRDGTNRFFVKNSSGVSNFSVHLTEAAIGVGIAADPEQAAIMAKVPASAGGRRVIDLLSINGHTGPYLTAKNPSSQIIAAIENDGAWHSYPYTALTNAIQRTLVLGHNTSGTPAANYGAALEWQLKSSTTPNVPVGREVVQWHTPTHASRSPDWVLYLSDAGGEREILRGRADGSAAALGFLGASPVGRQAGGAATAGASYGVTEQTMLQTVYDALRAFGLIS